MTIWTNSNGTILRNDAGHVINDETCCCVEQFIECPVCAAGTTPAQVTIEFLAGMSLGLSTCVDCNLWYGAWELYQLSQAEIEYLGEIGYSGQFSDRYCHYGIFEGLPCGALALTATIGSGGSSGQAIMLIRVLWADATFTTIEYRVTQSLPYTDDCIVNLTREFALNVYLVLDVGAVPCDFHDLFLHPENLVVTCA